MIVEIENPCGSCRHAIDYNETKVIAGVADLVAYANLESVNHDDIVAAFENIERSRSSANIKEVSFHASVNPSETDTCSDEQVAQFVKGMMERLGLGDRPYLIYKHHDIEREHYHVVSIRIGADGKKVGNHQENMALRDYMASVSQQYGFSMVEKGGSVRKARSLDHQLKLYKGFEAGGRNVADQLRDVFSYALSYRFQTPEQFRHVLESLHIHAELHSRGTTGEEYGFALQGLDKKGSPVTNLMSEETLGVSLYASMQESLAMQKANRYPRTREKQRLENLVSWAYETSNSERHFESLLRNQGVDLYRSLNRDGEVFGLTFVDNRTRNVFKGSEISKVISVDMMREAVETGKWRREERGSKMSTYIRGARKSAREDAVAYRDYRTSFAVVNLVEKATQPSHQEPTRTGDVYEREDWKENQQKPKQGTDSGFVDSFVDSFVQHIK